MPFIRSGQGRRERIRHGHRVMLVVDGEDDQAGEGVVQGCTRTSLSRVRYRGTETRENRGDAVSPDFSLKRRQNISIHVDWTMPSHGGSCGGMDSTDQWIHCA